MALESVSSSEEKNLFEKNDVEKLQSTLNKYIVQPLNLFGIAGFVFDQEGETKGNLVNEITDHYVEDNSAIQDHIASRPAKITLTRYVGELVHQRAEKDVRSDIAKVTKKLVPVLAALPALAAGANAIFNRGSNLSGASITDLGTIDNLYGLFKNLNPTASKQQQAYVYFEALQEQKILVSIQTPFKYYTSMAIESIVATQSAETKSIADFTITFKQIRKASLTTVQFDKDKYQERAKNQKADVVNKGKAKGKDVSIAKSGSVSFKNLIGIRQ